MRAIKLAPSILAADFARLGEQISEADQAGADWIHLDVMDGHFVPNLTIGPAIARAARLSTRLPLDTHLMVEAPETYLDEFADAGVDSITVHVEVSPHLHRTVEHIHELGLRAGVALNPATPVESLAEILPFTDLVLVMSVNPGFGGQDFISTSISKIVRIRRMLDELKLSDVEIEVDGGVDVTTAASVVAAGASVLVAGSAVYQTGRSVAASMEALRESVEVSR